MTTLISEDDFMTDFCPVEMGREAEFMTGSFDEALKLAQQANGGVSNVWTIIESGDGADDSLYAAAGFHRVNALGFIVTEKPWETGVEEALWFDEDDLDR